MVFYRRGGVFRLSVVVINSRLTIQSFAWPLFLFGPTSASESRLFFLDYGGTLVKDTPPHPAAGTSPFTPFTPFIAYIPIAMYLVPHWTEVLVYRTFIHGH